MNYLKQTYDSQVSRHVFFFFPSFEGQLDVCCASTWGHIPWLSSWILRSLKLCPPPKKKTMQGDMADSAKWNGRLFLHPIYPPNDSGLVMKIPQLKSGSFFGAWCSNMLRICKSCANPAEVVRGARGRLGVTNEESPGRIQWWKSRVSRLYPAWPLEPKVGCSRWKVWVQLFFPP